MENEEKKVVVTRHDPEDAEPGKGAPGNQVGVQLAQSVDVNDPEAIIPSGGDPEEEMEHIEALEEQEEGTGLSTTGGYVIDESNRLNNFAVEPEMYVEDK
ncbi:MAG TPA: hypothetical protein V6C71_06620 [Coleofasciculaceae cyanobacterium]|jgi:hypothetical protein